MMSRATVYAAKGAGRPTTLPGHILKIWISGCSVLPQLNLGVGLMPQSPDVDCYNE
jgi:hypothetical protein